MSFFYADQIAGMGVRVGTIFCGGWGDVMSCDALMRCTARQGEARQGEKRELSFCLFVCHGWSISVRVNTIMISL